MNKYPKAQAFLQKTGFSIDEALAYFDKLESEEEKNENSYRVHS